MKRHYYLIFILLIGLATQSCKTHFRISVKEPAVVKMPEEVKNFGIVNNVDNTNSPEKILATMVGASSINGNVLASERAVDGVLRALEQSGYLKGELLNVADSMHFESGELNWVYIDSVSKARNLQGLVELVEVRTTSPVGGTVVAAATGQRSSRLDGTLVVNYYIAGTHDRFERYSVHYKYNVPLSGSMTLIDVLNDIQRKKEYFRALGFQLGYNAGKLIYPNWVWVNRTFYNKGSKNLKRAKPMIREGNWDIAEKQLIDDVDHKSDKVKGRTLYNLALIKEGQGEIDVAIEYAERSALAGNKLANEYLKQLRRRKRDMEQINQ